LEQLIITITVDNFQVQKIKL